MRLASGYIAKADLDGCTVSDSVYVETLEQELVLYPNPNDGNFTLKGSVPTNDIMGIVIYNALHQVVYKQAVQPSDNFLNVKIHMPEVANGVYFLYLNNQQFEQTFPFTSGEE